MLFRTVLNVIIYSNIWIGLGAVSFSLLYFQCFNVPIDNQFLGFIFTATFFTYNFQRLVKLRFDKDATNGFRFSWIQANQNLVISLTVLSGSICAVLSYGYVIRHWHLLAIIAFFSFFYVWRLPFSKYNLRSIPLLKIYLVGITWIFTCILLPHLEFGHGKIDERLILFASSLFLFIIAITIPFDIRDVDKDEAEKRTIPQLIGVNRAKYLAILLYCLSHIGLMFFLGFWDYGILISAIFGTIVLYFTKVERTDNYFSILVDSLLITIFLLLNLF